MKGLNGKIIALCACALLFYGCEKDEEALDTLDVKENGVHEDCYTIDFESGISYDENDFVDGVSVSGFGTVGIYNQARIEGNGLNPQNRAMLFDSEHPTGDDTDLEGPWGDILIIQNLFVEDVPDDNTHGGTMELTFPEPVTIESMRFVDIDEYEDDSWVIFYDENDDEITRVELVPHGNGIAFDVDFGGIEGVARLEVVLNGDGTDVNRVGSGAIDNIEFCVPEDEEEHGCTYTQGYWKTHSGVGKNKGGKYDNAWDDYLNETLGSLGKYPDIMWLAPKGGDADIILAHQYIAAVLNVENGASTPDEVDDALEGAKAYFNGGTASRAQLLEWAEILDDYNNGIIGPGHCDD